MTPAGRAGSESKGERPSPGKVIKSLAGIVMAGRGNAQAGNPVAHLAQAQAQPGCGGCAIETGVLQHLQQDAPLLLIQKTLQILRNGDGLRRLGLRAWRGQRQ